MAIKPLFEYNGTTSGESLTLHYNKIGFLCVDAEDQSGDITTIHLPKEKVPDLINALCAIPSVVELNGSMPLVLYFHTEKDREEFAAVVKANMRKVRSVKV